MKITSRIISTLLFTSFVNTSFAEEIYTTKIVNHQFEPAIIEVPANQEFKLIVENTDKTIEEFESHDLKQEKIVGGGKRITLRIKPLKAGEYEFVGEFHEDTAKGKIIAK